MHTKKQKKPTPPKAAAIRLTLLLFPCAQNYAPVTDTAVKRYTHGRGSRNAREKQRQIVYKRVESREKRRI